MMMREVLSHFQLTYLPIAGMFIFLSLFIGCTVWVWRTGSSQVYKDISELPLSEEKTA